MPVSTTGLQRRPSVLTLGTFDLLHAGHVRFLQTAASYGPLTVGVNSDTFAATFKPAPVNKQQYRLEVVAALHCVHRAILNDGPGEAVIRRERPAILAIGPDWYGRDYCKQIGITLDDLLGLGVTLAFMPPPRQPELSSSALRAA